MAKSLSNVPAQPRSLAGSVPGSSSQQALSISGKWLAVAFAIAGVSDAMGSFLAFWPPVSWLVDLLTALLLFAVLGWHWLLLPGLIMEAIPGIEIFPFWLLVVAAIAVLGTARPKLR